MTSGLAAGFADGPIASHSERFPTGRPVGEPPGADLPSPVGVRPWNLRGMCSPAPRHDLLPLGRYHHELQVSVDQHGRALLDHAIYEETARSISDNRGDSRSEDWSRDYVPDSPMPPLPPRR